MTEQTPEDPDHELQRRLEYYRSQKEDWRRFNDAATESANVALRASILVNGGAAVAVLALLSTNSDPQFVLAILSALRCFVAAVLAGAVASGFAYVTNYAYATGGFHQLTYDEAVTQESQQKRKMNGWLWFGIGTHVVAVALTIRQQNIVQLHQEFVAVTVRCQLE